MSLRKHPRATAGPAGMLARQGEFTVNEAAEVIGRHPDTVRSWIRNGRVQVRKIAVGDGFEVAVFNADELRELNEYSKTVKVGRPPAGLVPMKGRK